MNKEYNPVYKDDLLKELFKNTDYFKDKLNELFKKYGPKFTDEFITNYIIKILSDLLHDRYETCYIYDVEKIDGIVDEFTENINNSIKRQLKIHIK